MPNPYDDLFGGGSTSANPYDSIFGTEETEEERRRREMLERLRRNAALGEEQYDRLNLPPKDLGPGMDDPEGPGNFARRIGGDLAADLYGMAGIAASASPGGWMQHLTGLGGASEALRRSDEMQESADLLGHPGGPTRDKIIANRVAQGDTPAAIAAEDTFMSALGLIPDPKSALSGGALAARRILRPASRAAPELAEEAATAARRSLRPVPKARGESPANAILPSEAMAHAGSASSPEAISRMQGGTRFYEVSPGGEVRPMIGVEAVDTAPRKGYAKVRVSANGEVVVEEGRLSPAGQKAVAAEATQAQGAAQKVAEVEDVIDLTGEGDESVLAALGVEPGAGVQKLARRDPRPAQELLGPSGPPAVRATRPVEAVESVAERGQRLLTQPPPPKLSPRAELSVRADPEAGHVATEGLSDWLVKNFVGGAGSVDARGNVYQMVARDFLDPRIRRYLGQELPRRVERAGGETMADLRTMAVLSKKIDKASAHYAKSTGGRMSASQVRRQMDEARRAGDYSGLPPELQRVAQESGGFVDRLSREYIDSGLAAAEETAETISNRLGRYLNTSHAAFDRPGFLAEVRGTKAWDEARSFFKTQIPDASEEEIVGLMEALADRKQGRPMGFGKRGGVGRKDLSNLVRQEEIPEPVRELLGVYRDYRVNFERTTAKMAHALAEHRLLRDVAEELKALGVVREPSEVTGRGTAGYYREIVGGPERSPLAGTFTTPRVAEVLEGVMEASRSSVFTQLSGLVKFGKVAGSPQTQARNLESGVGMTTASGNFMMLFQPRRLVRTAQVQKAMIGQSKGGTNNRLLRFLGAADEEVLEAEIQRSIRLGVVGRGANGREFMSYLEDIGQGPRGVRWLAENRASKFIGRAYLAGDDFWKFANWKYEADRLRKIYDGRVPDEAIEREAAEIVSQQMQTYDRAIPIARKLSRNPLLSPFVTFSAEMPRNLVNIFRRSGTEFGRAKEALAAGRTQEARRWVQAATSRLAGMGVALTTWGTLKVYKARENGITGDKEEAFRRLALPDYLENSQAVILEVDGDEVTYFDSQFADPYAVVQKIWVSAVARPGDPAERMARAADEMAGTFLGPEVLAGTLAGAAFGRDFRTDREITKGSRPPGQQLADRAAYVGWGLAPGGAITAKRVTEAAIEGDKERVGREAIAVAGPRISTVNLRDGFRYRTLDFNRDRSEITSDFRVNSTDRDGNPKPPEARLKAQQQAEQSWQRAYRKMQGFVTDGKNWGWSDRELLEELRANGVRKDVARALVDERTMTWQQYRGSL